MIIKNTTIFIILIILLLIYCFFIEPNMLTITHYKINDKDLSGIRIVFVGDFHIKPNQEKRLKKVINTINKQNPDIVLSVGDFVSGHQENMTMPIEDIAKQLKNIKSKYGFYTVLGNHDWWQDGEHIKEILSKSGIIVLENSNKNIQINNKNIYISGVDDMMTRETDITSALANTKNPTILLSHNPDIFPYIPQEVNLTLAGHTHGGQVRFPIIGAPIVPSYYGDLYSQGLIIENNKKMIVTKGIGNSILSIRFNCIPEIVVIEFNW